MSTLAAPIEIFYSYAYVDEPFCKKLDEHLSVLKREGLITTWNQRQIIPGMDWQKIVDHHLNTASIILLLISSDFLSSDYCYGVEVQRAMQRHEAGEARVIPVLLRPVGWQNAPFGKLKALPSNKTPITEWRNRDAAFADVAQGTRVVLEDLQRLVVSTPPADLPRIWNIPYPRNPFFTGQESVLTQLTNALKLGQSAALSQPQAINGLGGIGKTQIATEFAYQHHQDYQAVLWTPADTREALVSGYVAIAMLLNLPEKDEQDQGITVNAIIHWLKTHTKWLLILDSADELDVVREFVPPVFSGHILLTTRAQATGKLARRIEVVSMSQDIGALFLLHRTNLLALDAPLEDADASDIPTAREISEELGGLPLALDQAGAYIEETSCSLLGYLRLYRARRAEMLKRRGGSASDYPQSVATTWSLSFEKVEQRGPAAGDLLRFCAYLAPDAIPEEIIAKGAAYLGMLLQPIASDPLRLDEAISALGAYSLIRRNGKMETLSIHRLVQAVLRDTMNEQTRKQWAERAVLSVHEVFPAVKFELWPQCERYLSHALVCAELVEQEQISSLEAADLLNGAGQYLHYRARYVEAEPLYRRALSIYKQQLGEDHARVSGDLNNLAVLYTAQGKYEEALPLSQRALSIAERAYGKMHPNVANALNNLAVLYKTQGKYAEAEPLYRQALSIYEQQLGPEHPDTVRSLGNLAELYRAQGKYSDAEPLFQRALSIDERQLESEHPDTAASLNSLGNHYYTQGKYNDAEPLYRRALKIHEQQLGAMHPDTAGSLNNLAELYRVQGKYKEAEPLCQRALSIDENAYGPKHPNVAGDLNNLAVLYMSQSKYEEALPLSQRALSIREQQLGTDHPDVANSLNNLAHLYRGLGKYETAEPLFKRALLICEQTLGKTHPNTQGVRQWYILLLREMGRNNEATALEQGQLPSEEH